MMRALLILVPREPAIFSERAATEGVHRTRLHPTGASLLGWAAADGRYKTFSNAFRTFHSGEVRFSDAVPLTAAYYPAFRIPRVLVEAKHGAKATEGGRLDPDKVWVGQKAFHADGANEGLQSEALKEGFVAADLGLATFDTDSRLRTATEKGMAREGALFGYGHIEPVTRKDGEPTLYAATIEAEDGVFTDRDGDWGKLRKAFDGNELRLGRAGRTGYGGWYHCTWHDHDASDPWPTGIIDVGAKQVRVWVLSDLALIDERGTPCFAPEKSEMIGLPEGGKLDRKESAIGTRRFAPWNGHLRKRDIERQVIEAGSVLTYRFENGMPSKATPPAVGLFQEQGLGRLWISPPILRGDKPQPDASAKPLAKAIEVKEKLKAKAKEHPTAEADHDSLVAWAGRIAELANTEKRDAFLNELKSDFGRIQDQTTTESPGPSPSQWGKAAHAAHRAGDLAGIRDALFGDKSPACGRPGDKTRKKDWLMDIRGFAQNDIRSWLNAKIDEAKDKELQPVEVKWVLDQLAKHAAKARRDAREKANG